MVTTDTKLPKMMATTTFLKKTWFIISALMVVLSITGCAANAQGSAKVKIGVSGDMYYLSAVVAGEANSDPAIPTIQTDQSDNRISDLKRGKVDAVLLGREPTDDELNGLVDTVIAYDAACITLDENSYVGGAYGELGSQYHIRKTDGLKNISSADLLSLFTTPPDTAWNWNGEYYIRDPGLDPHSWLYSQENLLWIKQPAQVRHSFIFPVGKFDTQTVIYQDLGLNELSQVTKNSGGTYLDPSLNLEEEILGFEYKDNNYYSTQYGPQDYAFKLGFASRRVMTIASQHVAVSVVSVDGINPLDNPESIYDGSYKFSRKIHLLTRKNGPASGVQLADYLTSAAGQKLLTNAGYLPLINKR